MIHEITNYPIQELSPFAQSFLTKDMLLFDIETCGLSAANCPVYCIGCGFLEEDSIAVELFFAENHLEEPLILSAFFKRLCAYSTVITFNGSTFDIPFLRKRISPNPSKLDTMASIDLYKEVCRMKKLFSLSSYRQKALEAFLGIARDDRYDGGQLIAIYRLYEKGCSVDANNHTALLAWDGVKDAGRLTSGQRKELLDALLLHNRDDVRGMFDLLDLLSYQQLTNGTFQLADCFFEEENRDAFSTAGCDARPDATTNKAAHPDATNQYLNLKFSCDTSFPRRLQQTTAYGTFVLEKNKVLLRLPVFCGVLKHFFEEYKDYYYLTEEDCAVHKSIGQFVDAAFRKKATKQTCYSKSTCSYLVLPPKGQRSTLRKEFADKNTYIKLPLADADFQEVLSTFFGNLL